jgi:hypothetical protein
MHDINYKRLRRYNLIHLGRRSRPETRKDNEGAKSCNNTHLPG